MDYDQEAHVTTEAEHFGVALFKYLFLRRHPEDYVTENTKRNADGIGENPESTADGIDEILFTTDIGEAVLLMCHLHGNRFLKLFVVNFPDGLTDFPTFRSYVSRFAHKFYDGNDIFNSLLLVSAMIIEMCLYCLRPYKKTGARFASPVGKCWSSIFLNLFAKDFFKFGGWLVLQKVSHDKARIYEDVKQTYPTLLDLKFPFLYLVKTVDMVIPETLALEIYHQCIQNNGEHQSIELNFLESLSQETIDQTGESELEVDTLLINFHVSSKDHDLSAEIADNYKKHLLRRDVERYVLGTAKELDSNKASKALSETKSRELGAIPKTAVRNEYDLQRFGTVNYTDENDILKLFKALVNLENAEDGKYIAKLLCSREYTQIIMNDANYLRLMKETIEKPSNIPDTKRLVEDAKNIIKTSFTEALKSHPPVNQPTNIPFESKDNLEQNLDLQNLQKTPNNHDLPTSKEMLESNTVGKTSPESNSNVLDLIQATTIKTTKILQQMRIELSSHEYDLLPKFKNVVKNENEDGFYLGKLLDSSAVSQLLMKDDHYFSLVKDVVNSKKKPDTKQLLEHARRIIEVPSLEILENELLENRPHYIASRSTESLVQKLDMKNQQTSEKGNLLPENMLDISTPGVKSQYPFRNEQTIFFSKSEGEFLERPDRSEMGMETSPRPEEYVTIDVDCHKRNIPEVKRQNRFENERMNISFKPEGEILALADSSEMCKEPSPGQKPDEHIAIDVDCRKSDIPNRKKQLENKSTNISFKSKGGILERLDRSEMCKEPTPGQKPEEHAAIDVDCRKRIIESVPIYLHPEQRAESVTNVVESLRVDPEPRYLAEVFRHLNTKVGTTFPVTGAFELGYLDSQTRRHKTRIKPELIKYSEKLIKRIDSLMANIPVFHSNSTEFPEAFKLEIEARARYRVLAIMLILFKTRWQGTRLSQDYKQTTKELIYYSGHLLQTLDMQEKKIWRRSSVGNISLGEAGNGKGQKSQSQKQYSCLPSKSSPSSDCTAEGASYHPREIPKSPAISSDISYLQSLNVSSLMENAQQQMQFHEGLRPEYIDRNLHSFSEGRMDQPLPDATNVSSSSSEGIAGASLDTETTELSLDTARSGRNASNRKKKNKNKKRNKRKK